MRTIIARDEGAARLGEVALVDNEGRIGALDTVFYDTLLDENAALAHRARPRLPVPGGRRGDGRAHERVRHPHRLHDRPPTTLTVTGITADGDRVPVLVDGAWQI